MSLFPAEGLSEPDGSQVQAEEVLDAETQCQEDDGASQMEPWDGEDDL